MFLETPMEEDMIEMLLIIQEGYLNNESFRNSLIKNLQENGLYQTDNNNSSGQ